jgi:rRNA-processing protein EBP2
MVTKSKLRMALAAEKGVDFKKLQQKKKHKEAIKRKTRTTQSRGAPQDDPSVDVDEDHEEDDDDSEGESGEYGTRGAVSSKLEPPECSDCRLTDRAW